MSWIKGRLFVVSGEGMEIVERRSSLIWLVEVDA